MINSRPLSSAAVGSIRGCRGTRVITGANRGFSVPGSFCGSHRRFAACICWMVDRRIDSLANSVFFIYHNQKVSDRISTAYARAVICTNIANLKIDKNYFDNTSCTLSESTHRIMSNLHFKIVDWLPRWEIPVVQCGHLSCIFRGPPQVERPSNLVLLHFLSHTDGYYMWKMTEWLYIHSLSARYPAEKKRHIRQWGETISKETKVARQRWQLFPPSKIDILRDQHPRISYKCS